MEEKIRPDMIVTLHTVSVSVCVMTVTEAGGTQRWQNINKARRDGRMKRPRYETV